VPKPDFTDDVTILVDTREQTPLRFKNSQRITLKTGDYSIAIKKDGVIENLSEEICFERKATVAEMYAMVGKERGRFERELFRLSKIKHAAVICQFELRDIGNPPMDSKVSPNAVFGSIVSWMIKYRVPFIFAGNAKRTRAWILRALRKYWEYYLKPSEPL
jgi:ERCC4-type nuclease